MNNSMSVVSGWCAGLVCVGASAEPGGGAAGVVVCVEDGQRLVAEPVSEAGRFGVSVAIEGDLLAVGASTDSTVSPDAGAVYRFRREGSAWVPTGRVAPAGLLSGDFFGYSVALDGGIMAAGAWGDDTLGAFAGAAYVLEKSTDGSEVWIPKSKLVAPDGAITDFFGVTVALDGDTLAVGAPLVDTDGLVDRGAVYLYRRVGPDGEWAYLRTVLADDPDPEAQFGFSVAMDGGLLAVGATAADAQGENSGAVYLFGRDQGGPDQWGLVKKLAGSDVDQRDVFGSAVAVDGDRVAAGASSRNRGGVFSGAVFVFERDEGGSDNWGQTATFGPTTPENTQKFGGAVALMGDTVVVGAPGTTVGGVEDVGGAFVFVRDPTTGVWGEAASIEPAGVSAGGLFGGAVAMTPTPEGARIAVGADGDATPVALTGSARVVALDTSCAPQCRADLTGDGQLNFFDVGLFLQSFNTQDPAADFAPPAGVWNFFDISAFLSEYNAGCP